MCVCVCVCGEVGMRGLEGKGGGLEVGKILDAFPRINNEISKSMDLFLWN